MPLLEPSFGKLIPLKRVVASSLVSLAILFIIAGVFIYAQFRRSEDSRAIDAVPVDVAWLLSTDPLSGELRRIANSALMNGIAEHEMPQAIRNSMLFLDSLGINNEDMKRIFGSSPLLLSGHPDGKGGFGVLFYVPVKKGLMPSIENAIAGLMPSKVLGREMRQIGNSEIYQLRLESGQLFSWTVSRGIFIGSFVPYLLDDAVRQQLSGQTISSVGAVGLYMDGAQRQTTCAIRYRGVSPWVKTQTGEKMQDAVRLLERVGEWTVLKLEMENDAFNVSGQTLVADTFSFLKVFNSQRPVRQDLLGNMSIRTVAAVAWGMHDPPALLDELHATSVVSQVDGIQSEMVRKTFARFLGTQLVFSVQESSRDAEGKVFLAMCTLRDSALCRKELRNLEEQGAGEEIYAGTQIRFMGKDGLLSTVFGPLYSPLKRFYYCVVDNKLIMARQASVLRSYLNDYRNGNLLNSREEFVRLESAVSSKGIIRFYADVHRSLGVLDELAAPEWIRWMGQYGSLTKGLSQFLFSISNSNGVFISEGVLSTTKNTAEAEKKIPLPCSADSIYRLMEGPAGEDWLCVMDCTAVLHVSSFDGRMLWSRRLGALPSGPCIYAADPITGKTRMFLAADSLYGFNHQGDNLTGFPVFVGNSTSRLVSILNDSLGVGSGLLLKGPDKPMLIDFTGKRRVYSSGTLREFGSLCAQDSSTGCVWYATAQRSLNCLVPGGRVNTPGVKSIGMVGTFISQSHASDIPAFVSLSDSLIYTVDSQAKTRQAFSGQTDKSLCGARIDIDRDGTAEWFIGDERGVRLQTSDGWVLFRYPSTRPVQSVQVIREKSEIALLAWDGVELLVLNTAGQRLHRLQAQSSGYQVSRSKSGLFLQLLSDSSLRIRPLIP